MVQAVDRRRAGPGWQRQVICAGMRETERKHTYEWVMSHIWMSHVTHMNASRHTYEWVMSHIWMRHVTHMNASCHTYEWVMSHAWTSRVTYEWVMSHIQMSRVTYEWDMSHTWRRDTHPRDMTHPFKHDSFIVQHTQSLEYSFFFSFFFWHTSMIHMKESCHTHASVASHT